MTDTLIGHDVEEGEPPEGWERKTMGEVGKYLNGYAFNSKTWSTSGRPIIRIQNLTGSGSKYNFFDGDIEERYIVREGDLLFSWSATLGVFVWNGPEAVLNQHIFKVESAIDTGFHRYLLENAVAEMGQQTHGSGMVHITKKKFEALPLMIPPEQEQGRIVEILEDQLTRLDTALQSVQAVREKAAQFRRSLLHAAFTGALTGHDVEEEKLPEGWEIRDLRDVATLSLGKMLDKKQQTGLHPTPYLRNVNIGWHLIDLDDLQVMDISPDQLERVSAQEGDVVVCAGYVPGMSAIWTSTTPIAIQKALHRVRCTSVLDPHFLVFALEAEFRDVPDHSAFTGTTIKYMSRDRLGSISVPLPPLSEQGRIVEILEDQLTRLDASLAAADVVEEHSAALRRSLLHSAFTGRLTREWREAVNV